MKYHVPQARVVSQQKVGANVFVLTIESAEIAREASPGQFAHLRCHSGFDPLLRRPLSIYQVERAAGLVSFCYQVVGKGTKLLSELQAGAVLDVLGPLGNGFATEIKGKKVGLVGGGMGVAPLIFLGKQLAQQNQVQAFWGARNKELLPPLAQEADHFPFFLATEDGSAGRRGLVTALLEEWLAKEIPARLYACGPRPMLAAVARLARERGIPLQVSLEAVMACGVGACLGCTCAKAETKKQDEGDPQDTQHTEHTQPTPEDTVTEIGSAERAEKRVKVCQDGPVFWAEEVRWDGEN